MAELPKDANGVFQHVDRHVRIVARLQLDMAEKAGSRLDKKVGELSGNLWQLHIVPSGQRLVDQRSY